MQTRIFILMALILTAGLAGCTKESASDPQGVSANLNDGSWKITYFWDSDHDETDHFSGYSFTFGDNSILTATSGSGTVTGTWSSITDDSQLKLNILFAAPPDFAELSDDWHIVESTDKKIRLEDVSGGGGGTDFLTFEKN